MRYIDFDESGAYRTGKGKAPGILGRFMPTVSFYAPCLFLVCRASWWAGRGKYDHDKWCTDSSLMLHFLERVGVKAEITGLNHLAGLEGPCVVVANHMSTLETFVLPSVVGTYKRHTYIVKKSLTTYPVFGPVMKSRDPIAVSRVNPREDLKMVLEGGRERLEQGISIVVFPQTTRSPDFDPATFNSIGVKLAGRSGVPVVPVALRTDAWGNGKRIKDFGPINPKLPVHIAFGEPLHVKGRGDEEHRAVVDFIGRNLKQWGSPVL